jgi:hypothetical protein
LANAVLPTKLGLERFYREYARLYATVYSPKILARRMWDALFNRKGRSFGNLPGPGLIWKSLGSLRCMCDPREYLLGHVQGSGASGNY